VRVVTVNWCPSNPVDPVDEMPKSLICQRRASTLLGVLEGTLRTDRCKSTVVIAERVGVVIARLGAV
jgi:hypothetical protein